MSPLAAHSEPIWHCSRSPDSNKNHLNSPINNNNLDIASFDESENRTIEIQLIDLFNAYSGGTVFMGSEPLSACFIDRGNTLTALAMSTLDIDPTSLVSLSNTDSIVKSKIFPARNENQMEVCIAKNHPAIGFLSEVVESDQIGPCF